MAIPILHGKFRAPVYSAVLRRERLFVRLDEALRHPLTVIVADAGYGKSALAATYLAESQRAFLWLRLDALDRDPDVLFAHLAAGLADMLPACQSRLNALLTRLGQYRHAPQELAANLGAALDSASPESLVIVLDDFETVQDDAEICASIRHFTRLLPESVRLLILSRAWPATLPLARLGLEGRLAILNRADLAFTPEETRELFATIYDSTLSFGEEQVLHQHCEGWPAGLRLAYEVLSRATCPEERENFWLDLSRSPDIFKYLWSEALERQPAATQDFLLRTSVLASLDPSITDPLLDMTGSQHLLELLERAQLFIYAEGADRPSYRYHTLFHSFLHHQLQEREGLAVVRALHERAAELYEQSSDYSHAVAHYIAARNYKMAARVMSQVVDLYPPRTFLRLFDGWLEQETPDVQMAYPSVFIRRVLSLETLERMTPALEEMLAEAEASGNLARQAHAHHRLASIPFYHADAPAAMEHYQKSAELFHKLHDPVMEALSVSQMGHVYWYTGDMERAVALCEQALALCDRHRLTMPRLQAFWRLGFINLETGHLDRAERFAQLALQSGSAGSDNSAKTFPNSILAYVASVRGDHAAAIRVAQQTLEYAPDREIPLDRGWGLLCAGTVYFRAGDLDTACAMLLEARDLLKGYSQPELAVSARLAALHLQRAELDFAAQHLTRALEIARGRNLEHQLLVEFAGNPALPAFALENDLHTDYLLTLVGRLPEPALVPIRQLVGEPGQPRGGAIATALAGVGITFAIVSSSSSQPSPPDLAKLKLKTLGVFSAHYEHANLTPELKRRRSCRRLLLYLIAHRRHAVPREQIIEMLWPEVTTASGANRFHIALSWLRRILEPGITSGTDSQIICREEDRYRLALERCQIDADEFVQLAEPVLRGRPARKLTAPQERTLIQAATLYGGNFLEEYPYEEFLDEERTHLREMQAGVLVRLGEHYRLLRQAPEALRYFKACLALDPCREDVHRRVIFVYLMMGNLVLARRAWQDCVAALDQEMGLTPGSATQALVRQLVDPVH